MHIIFGQSLHLVPDSFTVLELDTFRVPAKDELYTAYCVVEKIPLEEFSMLDNLKKIHQDLVDQYKKQNWSFCSQAVEQLMGKFNGEVDSFYQNLAERINYYRNNPPGKEWDSCLVRTDVPEEPVAE